MIFQKKFRYSQQYGDLKIFDDNKKISHSKDKTELFIESMFHIAIENVDSNHYFSEKITNPLLCGTTPIYWGCKNIQFYFENDVICLTGNLEQDLELLKNILRDPDHFKKKIDVTNVKRKISLIHNLEKIFE